jgi:hypothetical protein
MPFKPQPDAGIVLRVRQSRGQRDMISENLVCSDPTTLQCWGDEQQKRGLVLTDLADTCYGVPITDKGLVGSGMVKV